MKTTPSNPNVHLLHEVREWLAAQGHSIADEYQIVIRRARQTVGMLTLLPVRPTLPNRSAAVDHDAAPFERSSCHVKIGKALHGKKKMGRKALRAAAGSHFYSKNGDGYHAMVAEGLLAEDADGAFTLTEFGEDMVAEWVEELGL